MRCGGVRRAHHAHENGQPVAERFGDGQDGRGHVRLQDLLLLLPLLRGCRLNIEQQRVYLDRRERLPDLDQRCRLDFALLAQPGAVLGVHGVRSG